MTFEGRACRTGMTFQQERCLRPLRGAPQSWCWRYSSKAEASRDLAEKGDQGDPDQHRADAAPGDVDRAQGHEQRRRRGRRMGCAQQELNKRADREAEHRCRHSVERQAVIVKKGRRVDRAG